MASCEKCWEAAHREARLTDGDVVTIYRRLLQRNDCSLEEQAGEAARPCSCGRRTVHQYAGICLSCGLDGV